MIQEEIEQPGKVRVGLWTGEPRIGGTAFLFPLLVERLYAGVGGARISENEPQPANLRIRDKKSLQKVHRKGAYR